MQVRIKFLGGARSVTGSKFLLEIDDYRLLIDCGLFQGLKKLRRRNWDDLPIPANSIDAVVLSHAHLDHSGYLPRLVKKGFKGKVHCTEATADLLEILWKDSAKLLEEETEFITKKGYSKHKKPLPLYTRKDVEEALPHINSHAFEVSFNLSDKVSVIFYPAGHILGAAIVEITVKGEYQEKKIVYSGDLGRESDPVLFPPQPIKQADVLLMESTYGNRSNDVANVKNELKEYLIQNLDEGVVMIPAFSIGRTQNLLFYLHELMKENELPKIPVYLDSPMAISVTSIYEKYKDEHRLVDKGIFSAENFHYVKEHNQSQTLNTVRNKAIIISASGMLTGGRILNHLVYRAGHKNDTLLFVGFQAYGTRGRDILEGAEKIKIYGEEVDVNCRHIKIDGLSAHADQQELLNWFKKIEDRPKFTFIVHGEIDAAEELKNRLKKEGVHNVFIPNYLESFELFRNI